MSIHVERYSNLATWTKMSRLSPADSDASKKERFTAILEYFIAKARRNNFEDHPATKILEKCRDTAKGKSALECIDVRNPIQRQDKPVLITMPPEEKYRNWTFNAYPLHKLWDALALIYTLTVGEIVDEREGELYLAQLKYISKALTETGYLGRSACPAIVGATWRVSEEIPLRVSFAFSCLGGNQKKIREEENASRRRYCDYLYSLSNVIKN